MQFVQCCIVYIIVMSLCQTFHKDMPSESRLRNKADLGVECTGDTVFSFIKSKCREGEYKYHV